MNKFARTKRKKRLLRYVFRSKKSLTIAARIVHEAMRIDLRGQGRNNVGRQPEHYRYFVNLVQEQPIEEFNKIFKE